MKGKLIVIEGTDGSGKETQSKKLVDKLNSEGIKTVRFEFPRYKTPTGKIIGGPYLGKKEISQCWFPEGANAVDPKIVSLYYAADRRYAKSEMEKVLNSGTNIVTDRYISANAGHQGGKISDPQKRREFYGWLDNLEYQLLELPRPDKTIFLYIPLEVSTILKSKMNVEKDQHELDIKHLKNAEEAYLQLSKLYNWKTINCAPDGTMNSLKSIEEIHEQIFSHLWMNLFKMV